MRRKNQQKMWNSPPVNEAPVIKVSQSPSKSVILEKYALMGIVGVLWIALLVVVIRFLRTFR